MNQPIKAGDACIVIAGAFGDKGPNVGKRVTVVQLRGEHSMYGRIWRCQGTGLITEYGVIGTQADFAAAWLQKIEPDAPPPKTIQREKETT